jgi:hypothetical protein
MGIFNGILTITDLSNFSRIMAIGAYFFYGCSSTGLYKNK